ncbi:MAG: TIM barrel protein [Lachnospiraceae bacterium]|nr:TIM barrel protein [Lachnospiraceae bacterium]
MNYKLGLVSVSFRDKSPQEILIAMKKVGLSYIEWGSDIHAPKDNIENLKLLSELQNQNDIVCSSYGTYFVIGTTKTKELEAYIRAAQILGTDVLRLWCGNKDSEKYSESEKAELFDECRRLAEIAQGNNVKLCMECHSGTYTNTAKSSLELMKAVNSDAFRMYWQPQSFLCFEENVVFAKEISPFVENIHIFNWVKDKRLSLGEGIEHWKAYLAQFSKTKTLLLEFMPDDKIDSLIDESRYLKLLAGGGV